MITIIDKLGSANSWAVKLSILIHAFFGTFLGETGDLKDDFTRYVVVASLYLCAFLLAYKYRKYPREKLLCYGFGFCLVESVIMQVSLFLRVWNLDSASARAVILPLTVPISHLLYYLGSSLVAVAFSCYSTSSNNNNNVNKSCTDTYIKILVAVGAVIFISTTWQWSRQLVYSCQSESYSIYNGVWHAATFLIMLIAVIHMFSKSKLSTTMRIIGATLCLWAFSNVLVMVDMATIGKFNQYLLPASNLILDITIPIILVVYLKEQSDALDNAINNANLLASDRNFVIRGFSHEIRTPLMAAMSFLEAYTIRHGLINLTKEQKKILSDVCPRKLLCNSIVNEGFLDLKSALRHISNILDNLSSFGEDTGNTHISIYELNSLTKIGVKYAKFTDEVKKIESSLIEFTPYNEDLKVSISSSKYIQILQNLIHNSVRAVKHLESKQPVINISLSKHGKYAVLEVFDNGVGMTHKQVTKCTTKYWTTKKSKNGGLGLYLVSRYISEFSAELNISSEFNKWTKVKLVFPLVTDKMS